MTRTIAFAALLLALAPSVVTSLVPASPALAETLAPDETRPPANSPYVTGTGATVPNPGQSQSGGTTPLDRGIQRQDNKIDGSICKGC